MNKLQFKIEQIALCPRHPERAIALLSKLGLEDWARDHVVASGQVFGAGGTNEADLAFNYQSDRNISNHGEVHAPMGALELEVLNYTNGNNWMAHRPRRASHLGMHVTADQLAEFRAFFDSEGIAVAQEVFTDSHTNPHIKDSRRYNYVIFDTFEILGIDLKFIVRINID